MSTGIAAYAQQQKVFKVRLVGLLTEKLIHPCVDKLHRVVLRVQSPIRVGVTLQIIWREILHDIFRVNKTNPITNAVMENIKKDVERHWGVALPTTLFNPKKP